MIAFIGRETLSVLNACPGKIPAVAVLVLENVFVKKWAYRKKNERCLFSFSNFTFHTFHPKVENHLLPFTP